MMRKSLTVFLLILLFICGFNFFSTDKEEFVVNYNGNNLRISIDGNDSDFLPTSGTYFLINYSCDDASTEVIWDIDDYELVVSNGKNGGSVSCNLTFKSNPLLTEMPVGSYVAYEGKGGTLISDDGQTVTNVNCKKNSSSVSPGSGSVEVESPQSCLGKNARIDIDTSGYTYGYCYSANYMYYTQGWRIAYKDDINNKAVLISAGSPECNLRDSSEGNLNYIRTANAKALKYCNSDFVDGECTCLGLDGSDDDTVFDQCVESSSDAWAIDDDTFNKITAQISKTSGGGYLFDYISNATKCSNVYSTQVCGYNNDLIDNGGYYWFAASDGSTSNGVFWYPPERYIGNSSYSYAYGLRPVISLASSVFITGGKGTMQEPYLIDNYSFKFAGSKKYFGSNDNLDDVGLIIFGSGISKMCISIDNSVCTNYINYSDTYSLNLSNEPDGEKTIYVFYKNDKDEVLSSMSKKIFKDTVAPTNSSVVINDDISLDRILTISSVGANYMCFSNTSNNVDDCTDWKEYSTSTNWRLTDGVGSKTIYAFFKDLAGNVSSVTATTTVTSFTAFEVNEDFSDNTYDSNITIVDGDTYPWIVDNGRFRSTNQGIDSTTSYSVIQIVPSVKAKMSFDYGVSSETNWDKLTITLTGDDNSSIVIANAISGTTTGSANDIELSAGVTYSLTLSYKKDAATGKNDDIGYIDNLVLR